VSFNVLNKGLMMA